VANDCSKCVLVHGRVVIVVEKGGRKESSWENDFVERVIVVCVNGLWGHVPLVPQCWYCSWFFRACLQRWMHWNRACSQNVFRDQFASGVVSVFVRIAHFDVDVFQLFENIFFGVLWHPFEFGEAVKKCVFDTMYNCQNWHFGLFWKMGLHKLFAYGVSKHTFHVIHGELGTGFWCGSAT